MPMLLVTDERAAELARRVEVYRRPASARAASSASTNDVLSNAGVVAASATRVSQRASNSLPTIATMASMSSLLTSKALVWYVVRMVFRNARAVLEDSTDSSSGYSTLSRSMLTIVDHDSTLVSMSAEELTRLWMS